MTRTSSFRSGPPSKTLRAALPAILVASAVFASASAARADEAETLVKDGKALMKAGKLDEACPKLEESQKLSPRAATLIEVAACHEKQGKIATAWSEYIDAEADARKEGRKPLEKDAQARSVKIEAKIPRVTINVPSPIDGMEIKIDGQASHAGVAPERGISAIAIASIAIAELQRNGWHGLVAKGKNRGTSNVGFIHGGEATNVVTDLVTIKAEARSHDPKFRAKLIREIEQAFHRAAKEVKNSEGKRGKVTIDGRLDYESFQLAADSSCVQLAEAAVRAIGREPIHAISNGGVDANWTNLHGIPTVTLGCGQKNVHMTSEMLDLPMYRDACRIALQLATA